MQLSSLFLQICCQHLKHTRSLSEFEGMTVCKSETQSQIVYLMNGQAQTAEHHLRLLFQRRDHIREGLTHASVSGQVSVVHQHAALALDLILNTSGSLQTETDRQWRKVMRSNMTDFVKKMNPGGEIFLKYFDLLHTGGALYESYKFK